MSVTFINEQTFEICSILRVLRGMFFKTVILDILADLCKMYITMNIDSERLTAQKKKKKRRLQRLENYIFFH